MKYNRIFPVATLALSLLASSCIDMEDNINPNGVTEDMMKADNLKTGAFIQQMQTRVILVALGGKLSSDYQISRNLSHDLFAGYAGSTLGNLQSHQQYIWQDGWINSTFNEAYTGIMMPWREVSKLAKEQGRDEVLAIANIIKIAGMSQITDTFGPIPYIKYGETGDYDSQEAVYKSFFQELGKAIDALTAYYTAGGTSVLAQYDKVYGGATENWIRFANTLRLRLALRVVYADAALARAEAEKSLQSTAGFVESAAQRAELRQSLVQYENPLYIIDYEFNKGDTRVGASIVEVMKQLGDPRCSAYFTAVDGEYWGVPMGITGHLSDYQEKCSHFNVTKYNTPIVWMPAAESFFLRAEAALRWGIGGDPKSLYEEGIKMSCSENGVEAGTYLASNNTLSGYSDPVSGYNYTFTTNGLTPAWDDAANFEGKLERISTQKWISLFPNGSEGWAEVRRTGYPDLINAISNGSNGTVNSDLGPRRLPFCLQERQNNADGVAVGRQLLGGADNAGTRVWWDKNPRF
ncbi:SusD/RagB family nutrient-binding outer membrane lipoprotein [uncultured Muribaculum sp.]|uniref:SusD/RagB family nutrient-binding outer membrane lipoprotein n=1 Tax=uncultured Muribaculum sp. TaxID=1918613 RepID=UPI0025E63830|nr:SusD/RagB family nutrient-binding outer membrane lipoprotein [uncultured Muribaculum sp.]